MLKKKKSSFAMMAAKQKLCPSPNGGKKPPETRCSQEHSEPSSLLRSPVAWKAEQLWLSRAMQREARGLRSCCSARLPAAPLQNTALLSAWARGVPHTSARTTTSHGREEGEQAAAAALMESRTSNPPNTRWFSRSGKDCETRVTGLEK